jgi:hypothetical protein
MENGCCGSQHVEAWKRDRPPAGDQNACTVGFTIFGYTVKIESKTMQALAFFSDQLLINRGNAQED